MKAVLLDFEGTLARAASPGVAWSDVMAAAGYKLRSDVEARYRSNTLDGVEHAEASKSRSAYQRWERNMLACMASECGVAEADVSVVVDRLVAVRATWVMSAYPEVPGVLRSLRSAGIHTVVCSNWGWDLDVALSQAGLLDLVTGWVASSRVGARKPHAAVFRSALELVDAAPHEAVHVGDRLRADVHGAKRAGIAAGLVRRGSNASTTDLTVEADLVLSHLGELLAFL